MASVSLDSLHQQQPLPSAVRPVQRRSAARNRGASTVSNAQNDSVAVAPNIGLSARLHNHDIVECIDLTASLPVEGLDPFGEPATGFGDTQVHVEGSVHRLSSMGPDSTGGQDDSDGPFLSTEEVQCGAGEAQEPQNAVSSVEHGSRKVDGAAERLTLIDYDNAPNPGATRSGDTCEETDGRLIGFLAVGPREYYRAAVRAPMKDVPLVLLSQGRSR
ncbi:hypothetical protein OEA41_009888 [Lepraria neglecta]|uniref:Uncharacterized protein n=1 Tax=Lepraria neglecta TaxID=209136 RepID=A0AAD9YZS1_9LECA|nr:hypothetical protein OEA41_009888 [Lepraria neglecta]